MKDVAFDDAQCSSAWDHAADAWREFIWSGADYYRLEVHGPGLLAACGTVRGKRVLDLGCGEGYFTRLLRSAGAEVTGIDLSERLLGLAASEENRRPLGIDYRLGSAAALHQILGDERFDLVTSCMAVQDMSDPPGCLRAAGRALAPDGHLVFSVPHPCTDTPYRQWRRDERGEKQALMIDRYFESGPAEMEWTMKRLAYTWSTPFWRITLSEWSTMIQASGLVIRRMIEPRPAPEALARRPELDDCSRLPFFLIFDTVHLP